MFFFARRGRTRRQIPRDPNTCANHSTKCIHFDTIQFDLMKGSLRRGFQPPPRSRETAIIIPLFRARARVRVWQDGTRRGALRGRRRCWESGGKSAERRAFRSGERAGRPPGQERKKGKKKCCTRAQVRAWTYGRPGARAVRHTPNPERQPPDSRHGGRGRPPVRVRRCRRLHHLPDAGWQHPQERPHRDQEPPVQGARRRGRSPLPARARTRPGGARARACARPGRRDAAALRSGELGSPPPRALPRAADCAPAGSLRRAPAADEPPPAAARPPARLPVRARPPPPLPPPLPRRA